VRRLQKNEEEGTDAELHIQKKKQTLVKRLLGGPWSAGFHRPKKSVPSLNTGCIKARTRKSKRRRKFFLFSGSPFTSVRN